MRKFLCMLFVFASLLALSVSAVDIGSADDLVALMSGELAWDADYTLTADIALPAGGHPIGDTVTPFTGTFDGAGHTISGLNLTAGDDTATVCGLFGKVDGATVKNLTVEGSINASCIYVGGIIGWSVNSTTVSNCVNRVNVTNGSAKNSDYALNGTGGIVGRMLIEGESSSVYETGVIENCKNEGDISADFEVGGIVGLFGGTSAAPYGKSTVSGCQNSGNVTAAEGRVAGIIGYYVICGTSRATVADCANTGDIHTDATVAAGIIGSGNLKDKKYTVTRCFNSGSVTSSSSSPSHIHPIMGAAANATIAAELISYCYYSSTDTYTVNETTPFETYVSLDSVEDSCTGLGEAWLVVNGYAPELAQYHTHTLGDYVATSADGHFKACYCGYETEREAHTYENSICTVCGASSCAHGGESTFKSVKTAATCIATGVDIYTCSLCGNDFEKQSPVDDGNHIGGIVLNADAVPGKASYGCADCGDIYVSRSETDIYVSSNGVSELTADNIAAVGTAEAPFANFDDAMAHAAAVAVDGIEVNVHIVDSASIPTDYVTPDFEGHITISGGTLNTANRLVAGGDITVENTTITPSTALVIVARGNKLVLGDGITMGNTREVYVIGGWDSRLSTSGDVPISGYVTDITVRSGTYAYILGGNRNIVAEYSGTISLTLGSADSDTPLKITNTLAGSSIGGLWDDGISGDLDQQVDITINVDGDIDFAGTGNFYPMRVADVAAGIHNVDIILRGKLLNLGAANFRGNDYTVNVYADTSAENMENTVASMARGEMQVYPIEAYGNPAYTVSAEAKTTTAAAGEVGIHTYTYGDVRVTVLSDRAVRIEESVDGTFVDAATLMVPHREKFSGAAVAVDTDGTTAILQTAEIVINLPTQGATAADVRIFDREQNLLFDFYSSYQNGFYSALAAPSQTPDTYVLFDNGIIPADSGMTYVGSKDASSDWRESENIDFYVLVPLGDSAKLRQDFVTLTGSTMLSDIKFYGSWYSRWSKMNDEEKLAMIQEYRDRGIPLDVIVIDTEWKTGEDGTGYTVNTELYPDMEGFLQKAEDSGVYVLFNDHTHQTSMTILTPEELKWQCAGILSLMEIGLDGWWYDRNWSYTIRTPYTDVLYSTIGQVLYYDTMAKYHSDTAEAGEDAQRVLMLTNADWIRHGYIASKPSVIGHRYGMQWTGDIYGDSLTLAREIENAVVSGVVGGSPYISADLGGFRNTDTVSENAFVRWMQFGAFAGAVRPHTDINPKNAHNPWSYTEVGETAVRNYLNMRYHLMSYHYALAFENYKTGMPLVRRLDFHYPEYEQSQDNSQYLLGKDILVAPYNGTLGDGTALVPSSWLSNAAGESGLDVAYYNTEGIAKANFFDGTPVTTDTVEDISFFWDRWAPNGLADDCFAARFTGTITPEVDCYIGAVVDDGARIFINGEHFAGKWSNLFADADMNTTDVLSAGVTYDIVIEYYEVTSKAQLHLVYDPVAEEGLSTRPVFIPDGEWIDVFTGETVTGPSTVTVTKDIYSSPIFVRKGAVIPSVEAVSPMTNADWQDISLNVYGLGEGSATVYEDDGATESYIDGEYRTTDISITTSGDTSTLTLSAADGAFATDYTERNITVRVHSDTPVTAAFVNGTMVAVTKTAKDAEALPFANTGASGISDVYEVSFAASLAEVHTITLTTGKELPKGDIDGDGLLTVFDAVRSVKAVLKGETLVNSDMNGDGKLTLTDILRMLKEIAK